MPYNVNDIVNKPRYFKISNSDTGEYYGRFTGNKFQLI